MTATWILAALSIALGVLLAADHRAGNRRTQAALDRANAERADKMLAFTAVDQMVKRAQQIADTPPLPRRVPGTGPQIPAQRKRGAA